jgi:hypothetical protein
MRTMSLVTGSIYLVLALGLVGCGGGETPPAKSPDAEKAAPAKKSEPKAETQAAAGEDSKAGAKADSKPSHKPAKDIIGDADLSFQYSFRDSDIREKKEEACTKQAKDDPEKKAACMSKAQGDLEGEYLHFDKVDGETWYVVFRNPPYKELHRIKYSIAKDSPDQITIKLTPPDKAKGVKGALPNEITLDVIDDYTISINDSEQGKKVYRGKTGLLSETSTTKATKEAPAPAPKGKKGK